MNDKPRAGINDTGTPHDPGPAGVSLARVIDRAGLQILDLWARGEQVRAIRVSPQVYDAIADARQREVARGYPLLLLDLDLIPDASLPVEEPVVLVD